VIAIATGLVVVGLYSTPITQVTNFSGSIRGQVTNYLNVNGNVNFSLSGLPLGAGLSFTWSFRGSLEDFVTVVAYPEVTSSSSDADVCFDFGAQTGSCSWVVNTSAYTVGIAQAYGCENCQPPNPANYTAVVDLIGWYVVSSPRF
jgi:hypothetical protein